MLRKATRKKAKIRLGLSAVSGGGKTYSALLVAKGICGDWSKIAIIDSENSSADLYAHLGDYNVLPLTAPFTPERYIDAIKTCEKAGMEVIIVDSITHEWDGKGGCLEIVESLGGKYQDWAKVTPRHQAFIDSITQSLCHVITTVRRKQDYEMTKDNTGKVKVEKSGLREVTREGFEYELTINLELDIRHHATASKDRTGLFMGKPSFTPDEKTGELIAQWCEQGEDAFDVLRPGSEWYERVHQCSTQKQLVELYNRNKGDVDSNPLLQQLISNRRNEINGKTLNAA
ncbi:MAG TPA: AAA family ATPase [Flavisolibacter sp.]